jgi:hypothetical protein
MIENLQGRVMALVDRSIPNAVRKTEHSIAALDAQLEMCAMTNEINDRCSGSQ